MAQVTRTTNWISGQVLTASALNTEFDNLLNSLNIVNADISASADITPSKILFAGTDGQYLQSNGSGGLNYTSVSINRAFGWFIAGSPTVANDLSWDPIAPEAMTAIKIWAYCRTAPTGSGIVIRIFNVTQGVAVGSVTISTSATSGSSTSFTTSAISQGDVLRIDVTTSDSNSIGANISVVLEASQP